MSSSKDPIEGMEKQVTMAKGVYNTYTQQRTHRIKNYKEEKVRQANKKLGEKQAVHRKGYPNGQYIYEKVLHLLDIRKIKTKAIIQFQFIALGFEQNS